MSYRRVMFAFCLLAARAAGAATVTVELRGPTGAPLPDAVVMVEVPNGPRPAPGGTFAMEQKSIMFQPHVLAVPVGATIAFPNRDTVRHHVYSFSKPKKFNLKLYGREDQRSVLFDQPGVVAVGCNIHDAMSAFIIVSATPFFAKTSASGRVSIDNVPAGGATLRIWSVASRTPGNVISQPIRIAPSGFATTLAIK